MQLDRFFDVQPFQPQRALAMIRQWGHDNKQLPLARLLDKLILLLVLLTDRYPADLERIGFSTTTVADGRSRLTYRLQKADNWSALQTLKANDVEPALCPVRCWIDYTQRLQQALADRPDRWPDRLFVLPRSLATQLSSVMATMPPATAALDSATDFVQLSGSDFEHAVQRLLSEAGYDLNAADVRSVLHDPATEIRHGGVQIAVFGNVLACGYNKPEGLELFLQRKAQSERDFAPELAVFVDDNSDNCWNMFAFWADRQQPTRTPTASDISSAAIATTTTTTTMTSIASTPSTTTTTTTVTTTTTTATAPTVTPTVRQLRSFWYVPPATGKDEKHDEQLRKLFTDLSLKKRK
jgi:hypothetical protein